MRVAYTNRLTGVPPDATGRGADNVCGGHAREKGHSRKAPVGPGLFHPAHSLPRLASRQEGVHEWLSWCRELRPGVDVWRAIVRDQLAYVLGVPICD